MDMPSQTSPLATELCGVAVKSCRRMPLLWRVPRRPLQGTLWPAWIPGMTRSRWEKKCSQQAGPPSLRRTVAFATSCCCSSCMPVEATAIHAATTASRTVAMHTAALVMGLAATARVPLRAPTATLSAVTSVAVRRATARALKILRTTSTATGAALGAAESLGQATMAAWHHIREQRRHRATTTFRGT